MNSLIDHGDKYKLIEFYLSSTEPMETMSREKVPREWKAIGVSMMLGTGLSKSQ